MEVQVLKDRVAIVTGSSRGLGEGIAKAMSKEGAIVALFSRDYERTQEHEKEIKALGQRAIACKVDVTSFKQVARAVQDLLKQFRRVDILVNNAGISPSMPFLDITDEMRNDVMNVNFNGLWNCTKAVVPTMIKNKYGKIINISSVTGPFVTSKGATVYASSKGAVSAFTKTIALELVEHGINCNAICPGSFDTPMMRSLAKMRGWASEDEYIKHLGEEIPMGRLGLPEDIGDLAVFLASHKSKYITGAEIVIDGGNMIQEHKR
jgi:NAD(P)-dependent dehydrogenase (short-subunit alcohol dehydrogenase family)